MVLASFGGILMDYHLIFILVCFGLFFSSIILIWLMGTKQAVIVAIFFSSINELFCILSMIGFFNIGIIGYNETAKTSEVMLYTDMEMFNVMFLMLLWLNAIILFIAVFKYSRIILHENLGRDYGYETEIR